MSADGPKLSILVVFHRMSRQAENTLHSLSPAYQRNVRAEDYEIVAVENASGDLLGQERATAIAPNIRYFQRDEPGQTPIFAANFAFEQSRAPFVGLMMDGAHLVTPRLVEHALLARELAPRPVVAVPRYHLGKRPQSQHRAAGHDERVEAALLERIAWKQNGYDLFEEACFDPGFEQGFLKPLIDAPLLFFPREPFEEIGGVDTRFELPGGGAVGIHFYGALVSRPNTRVVVLAGEGAFHQFHGGVLTSETPDREARAGARWTELFAVAGGIYSPPPRKPLVFGVMPGQALPFLRESTNWATVYTALCKDLGRPEWPHDP